MHRFARLSSAATPREAGLRADGELRAMTEIVMGAGAGGFNWLPVHVAERAGLLERCGLSLSIKRLGAVDKATAAVKSGDVHVAITPPEGAIRDCAAGGELRIVGGNMNCLPMTLVANARFKRVEDLKGAKLGTSSLTEGTAIYTMEMLASHGLRYPGDYEFAVVGVHPARWQALQDSAIDAALQPMPLNFVALDAGYSNLGEVGDYIPEIVFTALLANRGWATQNRTTLVALLDALIVATRMIYARTDDSLLVEIMMELGQTERGYATRAIAELRKREAFARDLAIPGAALAKSLELMRKANLADDAVVAQAPSAVDDRFRTEALQAAERPA
jgi:ABC-type nitrate/sulfonate/bicarbonate transport system substrate-binding protein